MIDGLTRFGLLAVTGMLVFYALEQRSVWFILAFAAACALGSVYGFLQGAWPFGVIEAIWALVALHTGEKPHPHRRHRRRNRITVEVSDRGPGLPPSEEERVFEKFYRSGATSNRGAGLGLAICKGVVEAHGGHIWAHNLPEGGVAFFFTLYGCGGPRDDRGPARRDRR